MKWILIGMRGAGKSTVGKELAKRLKLPFYDTDEMVEKGVSRSVWEIFHEQGEMAFREYESRALRDAAKIAGDAVIATGGGIVLRPENQVLLPKMGKVFYLFASTDCLRKRLRASPTRPSLTGRAVEEEVDFLFLTRDPLYRDAADAIVDITERSVEEICREIREKALEIKKRFSKNRKSR